MDWLSKRCVCTFAADFVIASVVKKDINDPPSREKYYTSIVVVFIFRFLFRCIHSLEG